jgi:hypothetical protein
MPAEPVSGKELGQSLIPSGQSVGRQAEVGHGSRQSFDVITEKENPALFRAQGFEKAVTIKKSAVQGGNPA